jgi:hypothetical protein
MTVVAVVLIILALLVVVAALAGGSDTTVLLDLGLFDVSTSAMGVFLIGVATALIFASGLELLRLGVGRSLARRRELKHARALVAEQGHRERMQGADTGAGGGSESIAAAEATSTAVTGTGQPVPDMAGTDDAGGGGGAHRATKGETGLPGRPAGTDPDTGFPAR